MSTIAKTQSAGTATIPPAGSQPVSKSADAPSLLVDPKSDALPADPLSFLYLVESKDRQLGIQTGQKKAEGLAKQRHDALEQEKKAIQDAIEAKKHKSFWDDVASVCTQVAKIAAVAASVAAAVETGGATLAVAGAVLSSAGFLDSETHVLQKLGVDDTTAAWIDTGLSVAGGAATGIGGAGSIAERGALVASGAAEIGKGAATIESGMAQHDADVAVADEMKSKAKWNQLQRMLLVLLGDMKDSDDQSNRVLGHIRATKAIQNQTASTACSMLRG